MRGLFPSRLRALVCLSLYRLEKLCGIVPILGGHFRYNGLDQIRTSRKREKMRKFVLAAVAASLLLALAGCGEETAMSLSDYRDRASAVHGRVMGSLEEDRQELCQVDPGDYYALVELQEILRQSVRTLNSAYKEALEMNTPPQVEELHKELFQFYSYLEGELGEMSSAIAFFQVILPMLTDTQNLATPATPEDAEVSRIKAVTEEDVATMHSYVKRLKGMDPPRELLPYQDNIVAFFRSIEEAVAGVERAVTPEDTTAFQKFRGEFPDLLKRVRVLRYEIAAYLFLFCRRIEVFLDSGRELEARIGTI